MRIPNDLSVIHIVTNPTDLAVYVEIPASTCPISVNSLRFGTSRQRGRIIDDSNDSQHKRREFREDYSKRSSESARYITIELCGVSRGISGENKILKLVKIYSGRTWRIRNPTPIQKRKETVPKRPGLSSATGHGGERMRHARAMAPPPAPSIADSYFMIVRPFIKCHGLAVNKTRTSALDDRVKPYADSLDSINTTCISLS